MKMSSKLISPAMLTIFLPVALSLLINCVTLKEIRLNERDKEREIRLKRGQTLVIVLEANPNTGYTWDVGEALNEKVLRQVGEIEFKPESDLIGAPGVQIIRFEGVNRGKTVLKLVYHRPWEKRVKPLNVFSIQVVVR